MKHWLPLVLIIPAVFFLFQPRQYWNMHDDMQPVRQLEFDKCLKDGQIPCRWTPDLGYGYGYPLFNYYPPLPYIIGEIWHLFGFSFLASIKLTAICQFVFSALSMYLLASSLFGRLGGILSSVLYTYAPYHAVNIYVRGAMNEAWALVFFPLIFYFTYQLTLKPRLKTILFLSFFLALLALSHIPMLVIFIPFLFIWYLFCYFHKPSIKTNLAFLLAFVFSFSLTAYFILPLIFESKLVQMDSMFRDYYHY